EHEQVGVAPGHDLVPALDGRGREAPGDHVLGRFTEERQVPVPQVQPPHRESAVALGPVTEPGQEAVGRPPRPGTADDDLQLQPVHAHDDKTSSEVEVKRGPETTAGPGKSSPMINSPTRREDPMADTAQQLLEAIEAFDE